MDNHKEIDLKNLTEEQKEIVKYINQMIIEHQQVFQQEPEELLINNHHYNILSNEEECKYLTLGNKKIKIYSI